MKLISCLLFFLFIEMHNARKGSSPKVIKIPLTTTRKKMNSANARSIFLDDIGRTVGRISIGTPGQDFKVLFDTGSPFLQVYSMHYDTCDPYWSILFNKQQVYGREYSSTYRPVTTHQKNPEAGLIEYGSGWVFGFWANDTVIMDGIRLRWKFLEVTKTTEDRVQREINGLVGLGYHPTEGNIVSVFCDRLQAPPIFSYYLPKIFKQKYDRKGELLFCGENQSKYTAGTMRYIKETNPGNWFIRLDSVGLKDEDPEYLISSKPLAAVDTGTNGIVGPSANLLMFFAILRPYVKDANIYQEVDCKYLRVFPSIVFNIEGRKYTLTPYEYIMEIERSCFVLVSTHEENYWILGEPFFRKFYTVFDMKNHTIGIATSGG